MHKTKYIKNISFHQTITKRITPRNKEEKETMQTQLDTTNIHYENTFKGDKMSNLNKDCIRIFYLNINGINFKQGAHSLVQLCLNLKEKGVDIISLTETNVHWKRNHIISKFKSLLKKVWLENKITYSTSETTTTWNSDCKPGGTATISVNKLSSSIIAKSEDPAGMGRWSTLTVLGKNNKRTTIITMYRPCKVKIENAGITTVVKQQWLIMQKSNRYEHPHKATITDAIKEIKKFQKDGHEIILLIDGNEAFTNAKGGIAKLCKECKLYDPFSHRHNEQQNSKSYIRGSDKIDFIFCSYNILKAVTSCGMNAFNEITVPDHCGLFLDIKKGCRIERQYRRGNITIL